MTVYKLTDRNMQTRGGYQWSIGERRETSGVGDLCSDGFLHWYHDPLLAVFLNPIHADIDEPRMFIAEADGVIKDDCGLKGGSSVLTLISEIDVPQVTTPQRIAFGILCAMEVCAKPKWQAWADKWLSDEDRSNKAAREAWTRAVTKAEAAAWTALAASEAWASEAAARAAARAAADGRLDLPAIARKAMEVEE